MGTTTIRWLAASLWSIGCAHAPDAAEQNASCVDPDDPVCAEYETRAEVMAAERNRERRAFSDRMTRLREAQARRMGGESKTSTAGRSLPEEKRPRADSQNSVDSDRLEETLAAVSEAPLEVSSGSSVRALTAGFASSKGKEPAADDFLWAARCLLGEDVTQMEASLTQARRRGAIEARRVDAWAGVVDRARGLAAKIDRRLSDSGSPPQSDRCESPAGRSLWVALRGLVGPAALSPDRVDSYARGLVRLRSELKTRAGLPEAP